MKVHSGRMAIPSTVHASFSSVYPAGTGSRRFAGGGAALGRRPRSRCSAPEPSPFAGRRLRLFFPASGAALFATMRRGIHRRPSAAFGFLLRNATAFVALFNMFRAPLLLVGICRFVPTRHERISLRKSCTEFVSIAIARQKLTLVDEGPPSSGRLQCAANAECSCSCSSVSNSLQPFAPAL
jgi:hypothetical protein